MESNWEPSRGKREHDKRPSSSSRGRHRAPPLPLPPPASTPTSRAFFDPDARPTARQAQMQQEERERRMLVAQQIAAELRLKAEAREREQRKQRKQEERAAATAAAAAAAAGAGAGAGERSGGPPPSSAAAAAAPAVAARSFFNPRDRPTARQKAEMEREEEEARVRRRARASAAALAAAEREAAEAAAAAAAAAAKKNKGKKRVLEDEDGDGERRANPPPLAFRPLPPKRTAVAISPRLTTARPRQQQQWQQQRQQQQPFSSSPSLVRPPAVAVAFPAPPAAAPATRRTEMNLVQLLQQRRQQQQQRATAAGGNGRKRPAAAAARGGAPPLVSSSSRATAAAAAASSFRGVSASADQEAHLAAANDLLAAEAMDGRLWFAACADGDEEEGTGGGAAAAGAAPPSSSSLPPVPASFPSPRAYVGSFLPLVLEEARQEVRSSWAEAVAAGNKSWPVSVERVDGLEEGGEGGGAAAAAAAGAAEAESKAKAAPESPFCGPPLSSRTAAAAMPPRASPPLSASSPPSPPAPAVEARLRFPGARPPPGALRDGDVVVVTRGLPPGGRGGAGKGEGPEEPPLDWAAGGRARAAAEGVELEEGELALDAAAAAAARAATASGQQQQPLRPPPPATGRDRGGACPVAGIIRFSGNAVTLTTRCRCPRHHRGGGGAGAGKGGGEEEDPPCVAALRSLAAAASSSSSSSATRQEDGGRRWYLTVVGNLVTHAREVAALFAMPAMPLARALLSPGAAAAAAGAAAARWPSEASSRAFIGKLQETYDHAQLRAIEVAAGHLSAGGGGGGGGGSCDRRDGGGGGGSSAPPRPPLFTLVQGPPGTGKTHTVTGILNVWHLVAYQRHHAATIAALTRGGGGGGSGSGGGAFPPGLLADFAPTLPFATNSSNSNSKPRLLVCAPSNAAADELLARVMDRGFFDGHGRTYRPDVVRVGADSSPMTERAREVWVEGNALALLEAPPAQRSAELQQARWDSARARRQVEALRLSFPPAPSASASAAASAAAAAGAAAREAAAGDLAAAADALDKVEALVERLEIADRAAQGGGGNGGGGGADRRQARERLEALLVSRAEVVFTTLSSTGRRVFRRLAAVFDTVLVDEAAQATEPALLQALRFGARSVALVGDPRQLPATVRSGGAARAGLARSLFERLAGGEGGGGGGEARGARGAVGRGPRLAVGSSPAPSRPAPPAAAAAAGVPVELLRVQYRMHPEIRSFPSRAFYAGALEDSAAVRSRPAEPWQRREGGGGGLLLGPYLFFDVARGREARGAGRGGAAPFFASGSLSSTPSFSSSASSSSSSPSLRNDEEAALAAALVAELRRECSRLGAPFPSVGVITPYRAQAAALRQELERAGGGRGGRGWCTAVETVDGFQGKEVDVAIVSCVRSRGGGGRDYRHDGGGDGDGSDAAVAAVASLSVSLSSSTLGFVDDLRRLNVAVTRARRALWVLGSGEALRRGSGAWAALLADASRRGLVVRGEDTWGRIRHRAQGQQEGRGGAGGEGGGTSL